MEGFMKRLIAFVLLTLALSAGLTATLLPISDADAGRQKCRDNSNSC